MADFNIQVGAKVTDNIQKQLNGFTPKTVTVKPILDTKGIQTGTKTVTDLVGAQGEMIKTTEKLSLATGKSNTTISQYKKNYKDASQAVEENSKAMKTNATSMAKTTDSSKKLGQSMLDIATKVAKFYVITKAIQTVQRAMGEAVTTVKEYDKAFTEASKVTDMSADGLESYAQRLGEIGQETAKSRTEMLQSATEFLKSGYNEEQSAILARSASLFQNIADSELSASQASEVIISNLKAFNMTASESSNIISVINEIANKFAVSSTDLSLGLSKTATAMSTLGNSFSESASLMVGAGEQMPNQSGKIARGLRSIGLEIAKLAQGSKTLKVGLNGNEIALYDQEGAMRSTYDILKDLYPLWQNMSNQEKASLGLTVAKKNNYEVLSATMNGYGNVIKANEVALSSQGSAERENEKYMASMEGKAKTLSATFKELVLGEGGLQSFTKVLLDIANVGMKVLNTGVGKTILTFTAFIGIVALLHKGYTLLTASTIASTIAWEMQMLAIEGTTGAMAKFGAITKAIGLNPTMLAIAGIATAVVLAKKAFDHFNVTLEEQKELVEATTSKIKELQTEYDTLSSKKNLNESEKERLGLLEAELKNLKEIKEIELEREYQKYQQSDVRSTQQRGASGGTRRVKTSDQNITSDIDYDIQTYDDLSNKKAKTLEEDNKLRASKAENIKQLISEQKELTRYKDVLDKEDKARLKKINTIVKEYNATNKSTDANKANIDSLDEEGEGADEARSKLEELQDSLSVLSGMSLTGLTDAFDLMRNAQDEMNSATGLTAETFEQMMSLSSEYLAVLLDQTGALDTTTNAQIALYNAKIDEMVLTASSNQVKLAETQIMENGVGAYANLTQAIGEKNAVKMTELLLEAQGNGVQGADYDALVSRIYAIRKWGEQAKNSIKVNNGFTKSTKSSTKANKENSDSLNELKKNYEKVIGYINDKVDDQIDKLKELKDTALDSIDSQIDKLNEQKDAEEKSWDAKIDALNAQNDAIEQQIELEQLQANLAKARSNKVLIYREGKGFGYESDVIGVADAQKEIDEFNRKKKFEDSIKQLENFRDLASKNYDKQIADLEKYRKSVEANYDAQIKYYEDWKNGFKSSVDAYENEQNRLLALQLTGIDFEKANWQARINNLASFVSNWNSLQSQMTNSTPTSSGGGGGVSAPTVNGGSVTGGISKPNAKTLSLQKFMNNQFGISSNLLGVWDTATTEAVKQMQKRIGVPTPNGMYNRPTYIALTKYLGRTSGDTSKIPAYASGIASVPDNQMAMVGDNPNTRELVIGSKLNGSMTKLSKGSQVVDAKTTRNIMGLSNSINGGGASYNTYDNNQPISIANLNISIPSITDGKGFSEYINNHLRNEIYQKSKSRG